MADNILDISKIIETRKKKAFKAKLSEDVTIQLKPDAPFIKYDGLEDEEVYLAYFKSITVDEDADKWDAFVEENKIGKVFFDIILEQLNSVLFEQKVKKDTGDVKPS